MPAGTTGTGSRRSTRSKGQKEDLGVSQAPVPPTAPSAAIAPPPTAAALTPAAAAPSSAIASAPAAAALSTAAAAPSPAAATPAAAAPTPGAAAAVSTPAASVPRRPRKRRAGSAAPRPLHLPPREAIPQATHAQTPSLAPQARTTAQDDTSNSISSISRAPDPRSASTPRQVDSPEGRSASKSNVAVDRRSVEGGRGEDGSDTENDKHSTRPRWTETEERELAAAVWDSTTLQSMILPGRAAEDNTSAPKIKLNQVLRDVIKVLRQAGIDRKLTADSCGNKIRSMTKAYMRARDALSETGQSKTADEIRGNSRLEEERAESCRVCHFFETWHEMMLDRRSQPPPRIRRPVPRGQIVESQQTRVAQEQEGGVMRSMDQDEFNDGLTSNEDDGEGSHADNDGERHKDGEDGEEDGVHDPEPTSRKGKGKGKGKGVVRDFQPLGEGIEDLETDDAASPAPGPSRKALADTSGKRKRPGPSKPDALEEMTSFFKESSQAAEARRQRWEAEQEQRAEDSRRREEALQARHDAEMNVRRQEAAANQNMAKAIFALVQAN
ncbi:hypothetical protein A4X06_0g9205, partial [Tilletia controversa]